MEKERKGGARILHVGVGWAEFLDVRRGGEKKKSAGVRIHGRREAQGSDGGSKAIVVIL